MLTLPRIAGLALLAALWAGLAPLVNGSMALHMVLHLGVVALVPALLDPRLPGRPGPLLLGAATMLEGLVIWGWHAPALHHWAAMSAAGFAAEQASFLAVGLLLWAAAAAAGPFGGALVLLATVIHMTMLGALIGLAPAPLYGHAGSGPMGLTVLQDQQVAGALMAGLGGAIYLGFALARLAPALGERPT